MKHSLVTSAAAAPFAHLLGGLGRKAAARRAEDDKPDDKEGARAEGDEDDADDKKDGKRGEDEKPDDKEGARAEGDDGDKDDKKDGKKAEDDDEECAEEDDDDADVSAAAKAGRRAERARCRKIFSSPAAGQRPDVAAQLAFTTNLPSSEAVGILQAAAGGAAPQATRRIDERMARVVVPPVGSEGGEAPRADAPKGKAAAIVAAMNKARGGK